MRAWKVQQFGLPAELLTLDENAEEFEPGPGQVKVQVEAAGRVIATGEGARVIAVAGGPQNAAFCLGLGADAVIDHRSQDITAVTRELTDGKGASVIYDPVGGKVEGKVVVRVSHPG